MKNAIAPEKKEKTNNLTGPVKIGGELFMGIREKQKLDAIVREISENEKIAVKLLITTTKSYYDAGNILAVALHKFNYKQVRPSVKAIAEACGFPEQRIMLALRIFKSFENNPAVLDGLTLRDALKLIAPPPPSGEAGYNRIDLGGDPGQLQLDFGDLFELPANANSSLKSYRTIADMLTEIIVVHRGKDNLLTSERFMHFCEDIPQNPALRFAYKTMSQKTQAAIEDYLAAVEQEEVKNDD